MGDLFSDAEPKKLSRSDKMRISRKATTQLTRDCIDWLNDTGQFHVSRSNNFPSPRITKTKKEFHAFDEFGIAIKFEYEEVKIHFKSNNITESILDISGVVLPYNGNDKWASKHIEIEIKTKKDSLSQGQIDRIAFLKSAGCISFVVDSLETLKLQIAPYMVAKKLMF